jgi:hypothetical protein
LGAISMEISWKPRPSFPESTHVLKRCLLAGPNPTDALFVFRVQHLHYNRKRWVFDIFRLAKLRKKQKWGWTQWSIIVFYIYIYFLFKLQFYGMRMGIPRFQTHSNIRFLVTITKASR